MSTVGGTAQTVLTPILRRFSLNCWNQFAFLIALPAITIIEIIKVILLLVDMAQVRFGQPPR